MGLEKINVYVKTNEKNEIVEIDSSIFLEDTTQYIEIDSGYGDKYAYARSQYLGDGLVDNRGRYNYKLVDGVVVGITEADKPVIEVIPQPTTEERISALEEELNALLGV